MKIKVDTFMQYKDCECAWGVTFSKRQYFQNKEQCWERFDGENKK